MEQPTTDHDLLITLHEQVKGIRDDIKDIKVGTAVTLSDHEQRIRSIESSSWKKDGAIALFAFLFPIILHYVWPR